MGGGLQSYDIHIMYINANEKRIYTNRAIIVLILNDRRGIYIFGDNKESLLKLLNFHNSLDNWPISTIRNTVI